MRTVLLLSALRPFAQILTQKLRDELNTKLLHKTDYAGAENEIASYGADVALIEIAESGKYDAVYCLALCATLRENAPGCKILLLCPEQDEAAVEAAVQGRRDGCIDDFLFCNATVDYITAKISSFLA